MKYKTHTCYDTAMQDYNQMHEPQLKINFYQNNSKCKLSIKEENIGNVVKYRICKPKFL